MGDHEPILCSVEEVNWRASTLKSIFEEVSEATGGKVSMSRIKSAQTTLEVGCGRGAYGLMVRDLGNKNIIIGIDRVYPYQDETAYQSYTRIIGEDVRSVSCMSEIKDVTSDLIIGIGLPPQINQYMIDNHKKFGLKKDGMIVLITDFDINDARDFLTFHGDSSIDKNIYIYESI